MHAASHSVSLKTFDSHPSRFPHRHELAFKTMIKLNRCYMVASDMSDDLPSSTRLDVTYLLLRPFDGEKRHSYSLKHRLSVVGRPGVDVTRTCLIESFTCRHGVHFDSLFGDSMANHHCLLPESLERSVDEDDA